MPKPYLLLLPILLPFLIPSFSTQVLPTGKKENENNRPIISQDPVVLYKKFQGSVVGNELVVLKWETLSERNNHTFVIERSTDTEVFDSLGIISGAVKSETLLRYSFTDFYPLIGISYYRLRSLNKDQKSSFSETIELAFLPEKKRIELIELSPNPFESQFTLSFTADERGLASFLLYDLAGNQLFYKEFETLEGRTEFTYVDTLDLPKATYIGVIEDGRKEYLVIEILKK